MRIVLFAPYFAPHRGGLEQYSWQLATRIADHGHQVLVVTSKFGSEKDFEHTNGFHILRFDSWNAVAGRWPLMKPSFGNGRKLLQLLRTEADVLITQTRFFAISLLGTVLASVKGVAHFHIEHGTCHPQLESRSKGMLGSLYDHTLGALVVRHARWVAGVSEAALAFARHLGAAQGSVVRNCVDAERFKKVRTDLRARLGLDEEFIVTFVGRLIEGKGVQDLIYAVKQLRKANPRLALLIVGDGFYRQHLEDLAHERDGVVFLGEKAQEEIAEVLSISDMFVNPSYSEGLPTSVLEAGAIGLPIVATDVGGTREIISHGANGLLVQPRNRRQLLGAMEMLMRDEALRRSMALRAEGTIRKKFAWDEVVGRFLLKIEECLTAGRRQHLGGTSPSHRRQVADGDDAAGLQGPSSKR